MIRRSEEMEPALSDFAQASCDQAAVAATARELFDNLPVLPDEPARAALNVLEYLTQPLGFAYDEGVFPLGEMCIRERGNCLTKLRPT